MDDEIDKPRAAIKSDQGVGPISDIDPGLKRAVDLGAHETSQGKPPSSRKRFIGVIARITRLPVDRLEKALERATAPFR